MLYRDGFFHADLHPAQPADPARAQSVGSSTWAWWAVSTTRCGAALLYYYYCLVMGDAEYAARYLSRRWHIPAHGSRSRRASSHAVVEICRRWSQRGDLRASSPSPDS